MSIFNIFYYVQSDIHRRLGENKPISLNRNFFDRDHNRKSHKCLCVSSFQTVLPWDRRNFPLFEDPVILDDPSGPEVESPGDTLGRLRVESESEPVSPWQRHCEYRLLTDLVTLSSIKKKTTTKKLASTCKEMIKGLLLFDIQTPAKYIHSF